MLLNRISDFHGEILLCFIPLGPREQEQGSTTRPVPSRTANTNEVVSILSPEYYSQPLLVEAASVEAPRCLL